MFIDIRRAIEKLVPNARWDFSIPNEGGTEEQYNNIQWLDERPQPTWAQLVEAASTFEEEDKIAKRQWLECGAVQLRRALRQLGLLEAVKSYIASAPEEIQEAWEYASSFKRTDPFIEAVREALNVTPEQADEVFELAMTL